MSEQTQKTLKSFAIALAGFVLAWVATYVIPQVDQTNTLGMLAVAMFGVLADYLRRTWGIGVTPESVAKPEPPIVIVNPYQNTVMVDTTHAQE